MLIVLRQMLLDAMLFLALSTIFYIGFLQAFYVNILIVYGSHMLCIQVDACFSDTSCPLFSL